MTLLQRRAMVLVSKLALILSILFATTPHTVEAKLDSKARSLLKKSVRAIKVNTIQSKLIDFVTCCKPNRSVFSEGNKKSVLKIESLLKEIAKNGSIEKQSFTPDIESALKMYNSDFETLIKSKYSATSKEYKKWERFTLRMTKELNTLKGKSFENIIYRKPGKTKSLFLVFAHLDNISFDKKTLEVLKNQKNQGANDNASGVIAALEMIRVLDELDTQNELIVAFTNFQEVGFLGMQAFIEEYLQKEIAENGYSLINSMNLLMIGRDTEFQDKSKEKKNFKIYMQSNKPEQLINIQQILKSARRFRNGVDIKIVPNDFKYSDHIPLWERDYPAFVVSHDWENDSNNDENHTSNDIIETLNLDSLSDLTQYLTAMVAIQLGFTVENTKK